MNGASNHVEGFTSVHEGHAQVYLHTTPYEKKRIANFTGQFILW